MRLSSLSILIIALILPLAPAAAQPAPVRLGVDTLLDEPDDLVGRRIGLVTHLAGVTYDGRPTATVLAGIPGIRLAALFAPEHGLDGSYGAGRPVPTIPGRTPVYSLYGSTFRPTRDMLARLDVLVIDLQDVGVRPYTYASTMALVMAAAREAGKPVVILDRPNPMAGVVVDGPILEPQFRSFIGLYPIPIVHGLTLGELARLYNDAFGIGADLTVVPMSGWVRAMDWVDTGLEWIRPSPGLTTPEATLSYAATGTVDGTNLWNGTRTSSRFQVVLAPWLDGPRLAERLNRRNLPGVRFTPSAVPHPRTGRVWRGVRLHVTDPLTFRPAATTVHILTAIRDLHPGRLHIEGPVGRRRSLFDIVWGTKEVRLGITRGDPAEAIVARWQPGLDRFTRLRETYLLYR